MAKCYASKVVSLATAEVGYAEKKTNAQLDNKTANAGSNNWNKYADCIDKRYPNFYNGKKNGYDWCDIFVDYIFITAFGYTDALRLLCQPEKSYGAGCTSSYNYFNTKKRISKTPSVGAQIFFTKNNKTCYHTGIVVKVSGGKVYTVEGNSSNKVSAKEYALNDPIIRGYGIPAYDVEHISTPAEPATPAKTTLTVKCDTSKYNKIVVDLV